MIGHDMPQYVPLNPQQSTKLALSTLGRIGLRAALGAGLGAAAAYGAGAFDPAYVDTGSLPDTGSLDPNIYDPNMHDPNAYAPADSISDPDQYAREKLFGPPRNRTY